MHEVRKSQLADMSDVQILSVAEAYLKAQNRGLEECQFLANQMKALIKAALNDPETPDAGGGSKNVFLSSPASK